MKIHHYIYSFIYDNFERELSKLESKYIFHEEDVEKVLFSDIKIEPSSSAFIKNRIDVLSFSKNYDALIDDIKSLSIAAEGFKVEYLVFDGDTTGYSKRLKKLKDIGYSIEGIPDYHNPTISYSLCFYNDTWYFGILNKNKFGWQKHLHKPCSYSNSININVAKALVNIAAEGDKEKRLLDACCGVGTVMLEACFAGFNIEGCDNNPKICSDARHNISHFNYSAEVYYSDIKNISTRYDAAIIDLPYNIFSNATDNDLLHIIKSSTEIADRLVIVSISDIEEIIKTTGYRITDCCSVGKRGKKTFERKIWVCKK